jgi:hypothetical protein
MKQRLAGLAVILFFGLSVWKGCLATTNEIGYLGADKVGRQILIQSLDAVTRPSLHIDSDFFERPFLLRLLLEPMRTTLRFDYQQPDPPRREEITAYLAQPIEVFLSAAQGKISLSEDRSVTSLKLQEIAHDEGARTLEDLYGGFGFKRLQGLPCRPTPLRVPASSEKTECQVGWRQLTFGMSVSG